MLHPARLGRFGFTLLALAAAVGGSAREGAAQGRDRDGDRAQLLLSTRPAPRSGCSIIRDPAVLPTVGELADSAALHQAVAAFASERGLVVGDPFVVMSLGFGPGGALQRAQPVDWRLPEGAAVPLMALVRQHVRPQRGVTFMRLRINLGAEPRFLVGRSERCPPPGQTQRVTMRTTIVGGGAAGSTSNVRTMVPPPMQVRVVVGPEGQTLTAILQGSSGSSTLDASILSSMNTRKWAPGLVDGIPTEMEITTTIRFSSR